MTVIAYEAVDVALTLRLLGPMQVLIHGRPLPHLRSRKTLRLLALLTLHAGRPVEREWLAGTLWPDTDQSRAFTSLRATLSELRDALGDQGERLQSPSRHALFLDLAGADVDLRAFDAAMSSQNREALKQAVALYRGPLLEDCAEEWVWQERNIREQNCLLALQTLANATMAAGDYIAAAGYCRRAMAIDPWGEAAVRGLMEALAKSGDRNAALHVYREYAQLLRSDPSAVPDEETNALYARLRAEVRQGSRARTSSSVGEPVLNGSAPLGVSGYLPHPLTNLIGREDERVEVTASLRGYRLVTLTGPGGIGKTRLALAVAAEVVQDGAAYPDGVWFVALESLAEARLVVPQIAAVLGLREEPGRPLLDRLLDQLRTKRCLLALDNCEHLLEAVAQAVTALLRECPRVRILATSREALRIAGEIIWQTPSLTAPDPRHLPQRRATLLRVLSGYESVQLFVERAQAYQKGFVLTDLNALPVAQVCSQLDGMPLSIELAAARIKAMSVEQIAARLNDHLGLLTIGSRTAEARQQTLRATLDWSYKLLSELEQLLLQRLSVFAGGWTLEAAEQVCLGQTIEAGQVLDLLSSLVEKSLVVYEEREGDVGGRFRLLETVRQYAVEHLQTSGEAEQVKSRHWHWCVALAEAAETHLLGADQEAWLRRLETEHANLRAALTWSGTDAQAAQARLRLAGALWRYWHVRGHSSEGRQFLEGALTGVEARAATQVRAKALYGAGALAQNQSDYGSAQVLFEESLSICRQLGDKPGMALATGSLADIARDQGDLAAARTQFEESLRLHGELRHKSGIATMLIKLGEMAFNQGELTAARTQFEESLRLFSELGNKLGTSDALFDLGNVATMQGDYVMARTQLEESLLLRRELGNKYGIAQVLNNLASAASLQGDHAAAQAQREESLRLQRELGNKRGVAYTLINLGADATNQGDYVMARSQLEEGLHLCRELSIKLGVAYALINLGDVISRHGDYAAAQTRLEEGLRLSRELGNRQSTAYALSCLGRVVARQGDTVMARTQLEEGLRLCSEIGDKRGIALVLETMAEALPVEMESAQSARLLGAAQALRKSIRSPLLPGEQEQVDRQIAQARTVLGITAFTEAWEEGSAMTLEQTIMYALRD